MLQFWGSVVNGVYQTPLRDGPLDGIPFPTLMIVVAWDRAYRNTPSSPMLFRGSTQMLSALTRHFICSHRVSGASGGKKTRGDLSVTMKT